MVKWALHHQCFPEHFSNLSGIATGPALVTKWSNRRYFPRNFVVFFYLYFFRVAKAFDFVYKRAPPMFSQEYSEFSQNSSFAYHLFGKTILMKFTLKEMFWNLKELVVIIIVIITPLQEVVELHKIRNFSLRISSVNVTTSAVSCGFGHLLKKCLMGNFIFCGVLAIEEAMERYFGKLLANRCIKSNLKNLPMNCL